MVCYNTMCSIVHPLYTPQTTRDPTWIHPISYQLATMRGQRHCTTSHGWSNGPSRRTGKSFCLACFSFGVSWCFSRFFFLLELLYIYIYTYTSRVLPVCLGGESFAKTDLRLLVLFRLLLQVCWFRKFPGMKFPLVTLAASKSHVSFCWFVLYNLQPHLRCHETLQNHFLIIRGW